MHKLQAIITYQYDIFHPDQTGFIKGCHTANNTRHLFNIMNISKKQSTTIIVSLDTEKAFDKVNWHFLFTVLQKFGFGEIFIQWIKTLYSTPKASVITNDIISPSFTLQRGTRQGCLLSPLLFAIFIEPLAAAIRQNNNISGFTINTTTHKISLHADDIYYIYKTQKNH